jgi:LysM repeat protein
VKGDTLTKIAHKFKTTPTALMTANNITDAAKLSIGKKLKIPAKEARSAKNTEPAGTQPTPAQPTVSAAKTAQLANVEQQ